MPIQFDCESCRKLIEVDEEWAGQLVECPFCRNAVRAPGARHGARPVVTATPMSPSPVGLGDSDRPRIDAVPPPIYPGEMGRSANRQTNRLAVVGLVLSCVSVGLFTATTVFMVIAAASSMAPQGSSLDEVAKYVDEVDPKVFEEQAQKEIMAAAERREGWIVAAGLAMIASLGLWLAGLICSLVAVTREKWRWVAVMGLVVALAPLVLFVLPAVLGVAHV